MLPLIRIWALGLLCILITVIFVTANIIVRKEMLLDRLRGEMNGQVSLLAMDVDRTLFGIQQMLNGLENYLEASPGNAVPFSPKIRKNLQKLVEENRFLSTLVILNADGEVVNWSRPGQASKQKQRDYFLIHRQESLPNIFIGAPTPSPNKVGHWTFGISKGTRNPDGGLTGVLVAIVDLDALNAHLSEFLIFSRATMAVVSPEGNVYSQLPNFEPFVGRRIQGVANKVSLVDSTLAFRKKSPISGKIDLVAARRSGNYPLVAMIAQGEETVLSPWRSEALLLGGAGLSACLIMFLLTLHTARCHRHQDLVRDTLHLQAITDPLTDISNRRHGLEQAQLEIKKAQRNGANLSFVLLDLDHFKTVNDRFGHVTGDRVLVATAKILKRLCRSTDIVSRFGGEEFLLVLPDTNLFGAMIIAEKIRTAIEEIVHPWEGGEFQVTASLGVAEWSGEETEVLEVLCRTDAALYEVKSNGRNHTNFSRFNNSGKIPSEKMTWRYEGL